MMKKLTKILSAVLCTAMVCGGTGVAGYAMAAEKKSAKTPSVSQTQTEMTDTSAAAYKEESVYVLAGADGTVRKIIVSDWIKNTLGSDHLRDVSEVTGIENIKGDEGYTMGGDNTRVWDAEGKDIYYQGTIEKELPVKLQVTYFLDGKAVSSEQLAGKSGKVTIRFDYQNQQYQMVEIDGKKEKIYVPFVMLTGVLLDNATFTHVEVKNGKLINDGDRTAVIGVAFPGLAENLGLQADQSAIPTYVEMTADVKDFKLGNTVTVATNELFRKLDFSADEEETMEAQLNAALDAVTRLTNGSSALYQGVSTLLDRCGDLVAGIDELAKGLGALSENSAALNDGAKQTFLSLLAVASDQLAQAGLQDLPVLTIENYPEILQKVLSSLTEEAVRATARATVREKVAENRETITAGVTAAVKAEVQTQVTAQVRAGVLQKVLQTMGMTVEQYQQAVAAGQISEAVQTQVKTAVDAQMESDTVQALIAQNVDATMASDDVQSLIVQNTEAQIDRITEETMQTEEIVAQTDAAIAKAEAGAAQVKALLEQLQKYHTFYTGLLAYTAGVDEAYAGVLEIQKALPALTEGVGSLKDGAGELADGIQGMTQKWTDALKETFGTDLKGLTLRLRATVDVAKAYHSFAGISEEMDGSVKFVYRTDAVK